MAHCWIQMIKSWLAWCEVTEVTVSFSQLIKKEFSVTLISSDPDHTHIPARKRSAIMSHVFGETYGRYSSAVFTNSPWTKPPGSRDSCWRLKVWAPFTSRRAGSVTKPLKGNIWVNLITTSLISRTLGIMVFIREIIPFYGRKIQVSAIW